jgi:fused signal recognition particle receptor
MEELKKIHRVLGKRLPGAPHDVLLVLDGTTGQNGLQQAREFGAAAGVTGLVVTKLDGTAKGGVIIGVVAEHQVPVRFIGVGEGIDDLQLFDARQFADALLSRPSSVTE